MNEKKKAKRQEKKEKEKAVRAIENAKKAEEKVMFLGAMNLFVLRSFTLSQQTHKHFFISSIITIIGYSLCYKRCFYGEYV